MSIDPSGIVAIISLPSAGDCAADGRIIPASVRSLLASLLAVHASALSARYLGLNASVEVRFGPADVWTSREGFQRRTKTSTDPIMRGVARSLGAVAARGLAALGPVDGEWSLDAIHLLPEDPPPSGSRTFPDHVDAFRSGYAVCKAGTPCFLSAAPAWRDVAELAAAIEVIVNRAGVVAAEQAAAHKIAPAFRPEWVRGFRVAAREIARRSADLGRRPLPL